MASNHFVWRLIPVPIATQIQQLLQDKQFELALQLAVVFAFRDLGVSLPSRHFFKAGDFGLDVHVLLGLAE